jgi:hypothetical protein
MRTPLGAFRAVQALVLGWVRGWAGDGDFVLLFPSPSLLYCVCIGIIEVRQRWPSPQEPMLGGTMGLRDVLTDLLLSLRDCCRLHCSLKRRAPQRDWIDGTKALVAVLDRLV